MLSLCVCANSGVKVGFEGGFVSFPRK